MSARSEITQGLKQFTEQSVELMKVIRNIATGEGSAETPESVMKQLIQTDNALKAAVEKLRENQEFQAKIDLLEDRIRSREADVMDMAVQLRTAETILQGALDSANSSITAIKQAQKSQNLISVHDLINYSYTVAFTSGRLPGMNPREPFPNAELFPYTRLLKELIPRKDETTGADALMDTDVTYTSFLGTTTQAQAQEEEEGLMDF